LGKETTVTTAAAEAGKILLGEEVVENRNGICIWSTLDYREL
jgi:hypothetical protein